MVKVALVEQNEQVDFDAIYRAEIDPWEQSGQSGDMAAYYTYSRFKLMRQLSLRFNEKGCGLEVGCGYGYLTSMLAQKFRMSGVDISPIAIKRAISLNPGISYEVGDIVDPDFFPGTFHFVVLSQVWYHLYDLFQVLENCLRCLEPNGLLVLQEGYRPDCPGGFDATLLLLTSIPDLRLVEAHYDDTGTRCRNDGIIMLRKVETDDEGPAAA
jgi:SAM-dependent methyltransferase